MKYKKLFNLNQGKPIKPLKPLRFLPLSPRSVQRSKMGGARAPVQPMTAVQRRSRARRRMRPRGTLNRLSPSRSWRRDLATAAEPKQRQPGVQPDVKYSRPTLRDPWRSILVQSLNASGSRERILPALSQISFPIFPLFSFLSMFLFLHLLLLNFRKQLI